MTATAPEVSEEWKSKNRMHRKLTYAEQLELEREFARILPKAARVPWQARMMDEFRAMFGMDPYDPEKLLVSRHGPAY